MSGEPAISGAAFRALWVGPPRWMLATAESVTCGRLQAAIGAMSGASDFFCGGITAYQLEQKVRHLDVDRTAAAACDSVSDEIARQMARGAVRLFGADFAAATTGYAEPAPARGYPQPTAYWAIARAVDAAAEIVAEGRIERAGLGREAMQEAIARDVMAALAAAVRTARAARP